jgi:hypothetical protein
MNLGKSSSIKEEVMSLLKKMPEDVSLDDIMYHLYVKRKILLGEEQLDKGNSFSHEEVKKMAEKW